MSNVARFVGEYLEDWRQLAQELKTLAGHRCVRCFHPFDTCGAPLPCDERCDPTRGRLIPRELRGTRGTRGGPHLVWLDGLNFGIHHLDGDKGNNRWWNLLPLCNSCHLTVQARVIPERPWLLVHSDWFKPYVGGFYAFYYGREDVARGEVELNLDRYLAMGQPWLYQEVAHA